MDAELCGRFKNFASESGARLRELLDAVNLSVVIIVLIMFLKHGKRARDDEDVDQNTFVDHVETASENSFLSSFNFCYNHLRI